MDQETRRRLEQKRLNRKNETKEKERLKGVDEFIESLKFVNCAVEELVFPKIRLIGDTWKIDVVEKNFELHPFISEEDRIQLLLVLKAWIIIQDTSMIYLSNDNLANEKQWIKIGKTDLLNNLNSIFDRLRIHEQIIVSKDTKTFLSFVDCDNKVRLFKGYVKNDTEIIYE